MKTDQIHQTEFWNMSKERLRSRYPESLYRRFIEPLKAEIRPNSGSTEIVITAPDETVRRHVEKKYLKDITEELLRQNIRGQISLRAFLPVKDASGKSGAPDTAVVFHPHEENRRETDLLCSLSFPGNLAAVYGPNGSGKTTLSRVLELRYRQNGKKVIRLPWSRFLEEFSTALTSKRLIAWKEKIRNSDILIIDDFQTLKQGSSKTQEELRIFIDDFQSRFAKIIVFSDIPFRDIPLTDALRSRFESAFSVRLLLPDYESRLNIIKDGLQNSSLRLDAQAQYRIAAYLSSRIRDSGWKLRSAVQRLELLTAEEQKALNKEDLYIRITDAFCSELYSPEKKHNSPQKLLSAVASFYQITPDAVTGPARDRRFTEARHVFAYLCYRHLGMTLSSIAELINRKDHTAVLHGVNRIEKKMSEDLFFRSQIRKLTVQSDLL